MKRVVLSLVLGVMAVLVTLPVHAGAVTDKLIMTVPINRIVTNDGCTDAAPVAILLVGEIHVVAHLTVTPQGNVSVHVLRHPRGLTGVDLISGATYHAVGETRFTETLHGPSGGTFTFVENFKMIGVGKAPNYLIHVTYHETVNANGELTVVVDHFSVACRG